MLLKKTILATALLAVVPLTQAANVELAWGDMDEFRDVRATQSSQNRFEDRVKEELTEQFEKEAAQLPADQTLHVQVNDLNLAGEIEWFHYGYEQGLRVIRNVDIPTMDISYQLRDAAGNVIKEGDERFSDLSFNRTLLQTRVKYQSPLKYERQMISKWYQESF
ncbi:MAG: DUF3016 domain-containing protein [Pseudomonadota bacterium]